MPTAPTRSGAALLHGDFATLPDPIPAHARKGDKPAPIRDSETIQYAASDRFAAVFQRYRVTRAVAG